MDEGVILWTFFNLRDGEFDVDDDPSGPFGLPWSDLTFLQGVDGPTRLLYSSYVVFSKPL